MVVFPSRIAFASFLQYAPRGTSSASATSRHVTYKLKQDGFIRITQGGTLSPVRVIDYAARRLSEELPNFPFLANYFNASVTLVPVPRSTPLYPGALWVPERLCEAIRARGLAANVLSCATRTTPVRRSAMAGPGQRPGPQDHYDSLEVNTQGLPVPPQAITIVDDVITRGSTFLGLSKRLEEAFPGVEIRCFALVRTISSGDISAMKDPVQGTISFQGGTLSRHP
jgi:hypothetical protein